ncbi:MAG: HAD family hydrolase [Phycisphaerae bacterium]
MKPHAAIFDLGGVIIRVRIEGMFEYWSQVTGRDADALAAAVLADGTYRDYERGEMTAEEFYRRLTDVMATEMDFEQFRRGWCNVFDGLYEGTEQLLGDLSAHMRIVALTNTNELHSDVWKRLYADAMRRFEAMFISHELGVRKPEPESYRAVLDYLGQPPENVVFLDDRTENVSAAERMGMRGILVNDPAEIRDSFRQLGVPA